MVQFERVYSSSFPNILIRNVEMRVLTQCNQKTQLKESHDWPAFSLKVKHTLRGGFWQANLGNYVQVKLKKTEQSRAINFKGQSGT